MSKNSPRNDVKIEVRSRHGSIPEDLHAYTREKVARLARFHDRVSSIQVVSEHSNAHTDIEMIVHVDSGATLVARQADAQYKSALEKVMGKMERQLKKHNEKLKHHKGEGAKGSEPSSGPEGPPEDSYEDIVRKDLKG